MEHRLGENVIDTDHLAIFGRLLKRIPSGVSRIGEELISLAPIVNPCINRTGDRSVACGSRLLCLHTKNELISV